MSTTAPATNIGFVLNRTASALRQRLGQAFRRNGYDVTPEEWSILNQLWQRDGQSQGEIAEHSVRDRTTVTRLLDGMVAKGLVTRQPDEIDRRVVCAWLTARGRALQRTLVPIATRFLREGTHGVNQRDLALTLKTLQRVQENLKRL